MKKKPVIFDFDGVLADSFQALYELNVFALRLIGHEINEKDYRDWYITGIKKTKRELITDDKEYQKMLQAFNARNREFYRKVKLFPWTRDLLTGLERIADLVVVSSTSNILIRELLDKNRIHHCFKAILGRPDLGKGRMFSEALKLLQSRPEDIFFISDTAGDIREGKDVGFQTVAVTWGFHDQKILEAANPKKIVNTPEQLFEYIKSQ